MMGQSAYRPHRLKMNLICMMLASFMVTAPINADLVKQEESGKESAYDKEYKKILRRERALTNKNEALEGFISGVAATIIGTYGIYNDDRGLLTRVLYSATQTAGTIAASNYLLMMRSPSIILETDEMLRRNSQLSREDYQRLLVRLEHQRARAVATQVAYSSLFLAGLNGYNGYREKNAGLRNVFYFLSFNFTLVSAISFVQQSSLTTSENALSFDLSGDGQSIASGFQIRF